MNSLLTYAGILTIAIGIAHSWLGERYIIVRLLRKEDLPKLFGDDTFTKQTLRFGWHLTTAAWWGLAVILFIMAGLFPEIEIVQGIVLAIGSTFFVSATLSFIFTRGRHISWIVFITIAFLCGFTAF